MWRTRRFVQGVAYLKQGNSSQQVGVSEITGTFLGVHIRKGTGFGGAGGKGGLKGERCRGIGRRVKQQGDRGGTAAGGRSQIAV